MSATASMDSRRRPPLVLEQDRAIWNAVFPVRTLRPTAASLVVSPEPVPPVRTRSLPMPSVPEIDAMIEPGAENG